MKEALNPDARGEQLVRNLLHGDSVKRQAAIESLRSAIAARDARPLPEPVLEALVRCVGDSRKSVQRRAIDALAAVSASGDVRVVKLLRHTVAGTDRRVRWASAYALAQIGADYLARDIIDAVCEALSADDSDIRWAAANLLVRLGRDHPAEIRERLLALATAPDSNARKMALYCIRDLGIGGNDLLDAIGRLIHDRDVHVRLAALAVLARLDDSNGAAASLTLQVLENDPDAGVRRAGAAALGNRKSATSPAGAALRAAARDKSDASLARAAQSALDRLEKR